MLLRGLLSGWGYSIKTCSQQCGAQGRLAVDTFIVTLPESISSGEAGSHDLQETGSVWWFRKGEGS